MLLFDKEVVTIKPSETTTANWRMFAELVLSGEKQTDAYRLVYGQGNMTNKTLNEKACRLIHSKGVVAILDEIKKSIALNSEWSRKDTLDRLLQIAEEAKDASKIPIKDKDGHITGYKYNAAAATVAVKSYEAVSKMCGFNEPDKVENHMEIVIGESMNEFAE